MNDEHESPPLDRREWADLPRRVDPARLLEADLPKFRRWLVSRLKVNVTGAGPTDDDLLCEAAIVKIIDELMRRRG